MQTITLDLQGIEVVSWDLDGTIYDLGIATQHVHDELASWLRQGRIAKTVTVVLVALIYRAIVGFAVHVRGGVVDVPTWLWQTRPFRWLFDDLFLAGITKTDIRASWLAASDAIAASGRRQVIVSNAETAQKLAFFGLTDRFDAIYPCLLDGLLKPAPQTLTRVAADLSVPIEAILHVGDRRSTDLEAARRAGCPGVLLSDGEVRFELIRLAR